MRKEGFFVCACSKYRVKSVVVVGGVTRKKSFRLVVLERMRL